MPCAALCRSAFYLPRPLPLNHYVADRWGGPTLCLQGALDPLNDARGASRPPPPPSLPGMHCASLPPWLSLRGPPGLPGMHCTSLPPWLSLGGPPGLPACLRFSGASVLPPRGWQGPPSPPTLPSRRCGAQDRGSPGQVCRLLSTCLGGRQPARSLRFGTRFRRPSQFVMLHWRCLPRSSAPAPRRAHARALAARYEAARSSEAL